MTNYIMHYGTKGQKWGIRNYQEKNGSYVVGQEGRYDPLYNQRHHRNSHTYNRQAQARITRKKLGVNVTYNKKHFDQMIKKGVDLTTLSYDADRTKNVDMFYAAYKNLDKHEYNALFNKPIKNYDVDENGNKIGPIKCFKFRINNTAQNDIKVASEDSGANAFLKLYEKSSDFANFVKDPDRMQSLFVDEKYKFKGYREAREALERIRSSKVPDENDLRIAYRMFNYVIPSDGSGSADQAKAATDVQIQRARLFKQLKDDGYGAVLDTNDSIYGGFKTSGSVIVFDMSQIALKPDTARVTTQSKQFSNVVFATRKLLGI